MLILTRKLNESIIIDGKITVKVVKVEGETVKLGIQAPLDVPVHRQEVYEEILKNNQAAQTRGPQVLPKLPLRTNTNKPSGNAGVSADHGVGPK